MRHDIVFYLVPEFDVLSFSAAIEALRLTNVVLGYEAYSWKIVSAHGSDVSASCGLAFSASNSITIERSHLIAGKRPAAVIICSGSNPKRYRDRATEAWLRECDNRGILLVGLSSGAQVLADAGLLAGRKCTIHWQNLPAFVEDNGLISASLCIYEIDGNIYTSAGGASSLDVMACLISSHFSEDVFARVCQHLVADQVRSATARQRLPLSRRLGACSDVVLSVVRKMEETIDAPMRMAALADETRVSRRQMERLFRFEFGCSPARYYVNLRLEHANLLLVQTKLAIIDITVACGFVSASHFSKVYRETYGCTPQATRVAHRFLPTPFSDTKEVIQIAS